MSGSALWDGMRGMGWRKCVVFTFRPSRGSILVYYGGPDDTQRAVTTQPNTVHYSSVHNDLFSFPCTRNPHLCTHLYFVTRPSYTYKHKTLC